MHGRDQPTLDPNSLLVARATGRRPARRIFSYESITRILQSDLERQQPFEVRENLTRVLLGRPANILMVGLTILLCGGFAALRHDGVVGLTIGGAAFVLVVFRCAIILKFIARYERKPCADLDPWIVGFGLTAVGTSIAWGAVTFWSLAITNDTVLFTITLVVNAGTAGAIAARNAAAPRIAKLQLLTSLLPMMSGSLFVQDPAYRVFIILVPALIYGLFVLIADMYERLVDLFRSQSKLSALSNIDPLTQIANRRYFATSSLNALEICRAQRQPLAILMIDVDYFKPFNDYYGHQAGDMCLQRVAAILRDNLRDAGDMVARYGGEEFAIYLINADPGEAAQVAQRLCQSVEQAGLPHCNRPDQTAVVTVSVGVVATDQLYAGLDALVNDADKALYRAKTLGRNRMFLAPAYRCAG